MTLPALNAQRNLLLKAMPAQDFVLLQPHLERVHLTKNMILAGAGQPIEHAYFLEGGVASVVAIDGRGMRTEVGLFGRDGMCGIALLLGADSSPLETFIQIPGGAALRMTSEHLLRAVAESDSLRGLMFRFAQAFIIQISHTAASNASAGLQARLARWLLMCHDRLDGDEIPLTHQFLAMMLSVRRSGVTVILQQLEKSGAVRGARGLIRVVDRARLEQVAGDAYGASEAEYRRLIGPFGK